MSQEGEQRRQYVIEALKKAREDFKNIIFDKPKERHEQYESPKTRYEQYENECIKYNETIDEMVLFSRLSRRDFESQPEKNVMLLKEYMDLRRPKMDDYLSRNEQKSFVDCNIENKPDLERLCKIMRDDKCLRCIYFNK